MTILLLFTVVSLSIILIKISKKFTILSSYAGDPHQNFLNSKNVPLIGGLIIIASFSIIIYEKNFEIVFFSLLIFLIGFFSDLRKLNSPLNRFYLQILIVIFSVIFLNLNLNNLRINFLDYLLTINFFNIFFVSLCLVVLLNGSNFIDGLNGLCLGYYVLILLILFKLDNQITNYFDKEILLSICLVMIILFVFNINNKLFLGDSGAYTLGFLFGVLLIKTYQNNQFISPFFIALLLWYPSLEVLFSIIRKINQKFSVMKPDTYHFHQLLFNFLKNKNNYNEQYNNNLSGVVINIFNLIIFFIGSFFISSSFIQLSLIFICYLAYIITYISLRNITN